MKKFNVLLVVLAATVTMLTGCSGNNEVYSYSEYYHNNTALADHPIVGEWYSYQTFTWYYTFNADGTGLMAPEFAFYWSLEDGLIQIEILDESTYWEYDLAGDSLTLISTLLPGLDLELNFFRAGTEPDLSDWDFDFDFDFDYDFEEDEE